MIYLDHSATTPVDQRVVEAMLPYWTEFYGNPSSLYGLGRRAAAALEDARARIARVLNCQPAEIVFTGCGSESDNLAIRGIAFAAAAKGKRHIITTPIEHHAVLHTAADLAERFDFEVTQVPVDRYGLVNPAAVAAAVRPDTALISVMYANNEVGTIEPLAEIGAVARRHGIPLHTDAVQAGGQLSLDVQALNVDLLALSAHKFYGPKGVGLLYVRHGTRLLPAQTGGSQERGRRAGTENVPYIVGMAAALELAQAEREAEEARLAGLARPARHLAAGAHPRRGTDGTSDPAAAGSCQPGHPRRRSPVGPDCPGSGGCGGVLRLGVRQRCANPQPRAHGDGLRPNRRAWSTAADVRSGEYRGGRGFRAGEAAGDRGKVARERVDEQTRKQGNKETRRPLPCLLVYLSTGLPGY